MTSIANVDKAELLCTLFNNARVNGYCIEGGERAVPVEEAGYDRTAPLTPEEARDYLDLADYCFVGRDIRGRWLEVDLKGDEVELSQYDEHFGVSGDKLIERLERTGDYSRLPSLGD